MPKLTVVLATATQGGGFPLYGNAFAEVMMQADPTLVVETRNTMGSSENIPSLEANKFDLGLVAGESFNQAREGVGAASDQAERPDRDLRHRRHVRGARRQQVSQHSGSGRQAHCFWCQGLGHSDPRRATCWMESD